MVDEHSTPKPTRKRKHVSSDASPGHPPPRIAKKSTTGAMPRKVSKAIASTRTPASSPKKKSTNALAGPSRLAARPAKPRPRPPVVAPHTDSDSDPPSSILIKATKKNPPKKKVIHLGVVEISSDEEDEGEEKTPSQPTKIFDFDVINLCDSSEEDKNRVPVPQRTPSKPGKGNISLSESEDNGNSVPVAPYKGKVYTRLKKQLPSKAQVTPVASGSKAPPVNTKKRRLFLSPSPDSSSVEDTPTFTERLARFHERADTPERVEERESIPISPPQQASSPYKERTRTPSAAPPGSLQASLNDALERANKRPRILRPRPFVSKLSTSKYERSTNRPPSDDPPARPPGTLLTHVFFAKAMSEVKTKIEVARKRARKRRRLALENDSTTTAQVISTTVAPLVQDVVVQDVAVSISTEQQETFVTEMVILEEVDPPSPIKCDPSPRKIDLSGKVKKEAINSRRLMELLRTKRTSLNPATDIMISSPTSVFDEHVQSSRSAPDTSTSPPETPAVSSATLLSPAVGGAESSATKGIFSMSLSEAPSHLATTDLMDTVFMDNNDDGDETDSSLGGLEFSYPAEF